MRTELSCLECDCAIQLRFLGAWAECPQTQVVNEGDVVSWVPVQAVGSAGEGDSVQHPVDRSHHLHHIYHLHNGGGGATHIFSVLLSRTVDDRQTAGDEVVLEG